MKKLLYYFVILFFLQLPNLGFSMQVDSLKEKEVYDPWFAYDKVLHFGVSFSIVLSTQYILENKLSIEKDDALPIGVFVSAINGLYKELWDKKVSNFFSKRDLIADAAGILVAAVIVKNNF